MEVKVCSLGRVSPRRRRIHDGTNSETKLKVMRTCEAVLEKFQTSRIDFEYGPPELNLYDYVAEEARFLWTKARTYFILKPESEPKKGILLFHIQGEDLSNLCRKHMEFDLHSTTLSKVHIKSYNQGDFACIFYLGKEFWKLTQPENTQVLKEMSEHVKRSHIFVILDSEKENSNAVNICSKSDICPVTHIFTNGSDKTHLYQTMYEILENQITSFLSDLNSRVSTRMVKDFTRELEDFCKKLQQRRERPKQSLTKQCIEKIRAAYDTGCVGYCLRGNDLYIFEDDTISADNPKKLKNRKSIRDAFKDGKVFFKLFHDVVSPQCAISCGGPVGKITGETGTLGMFGKLRNNEASRPIEEIIVAISSGHVLETGADAFVPRIGKVGKCMWPVHAANNMFDVSVIKIDPHLINSMQRFILDEKVTLMQISHKDLENRRVFKFGATTGRTDGFVTTVDDFELFGEKVLAIRPKRSTCSENKFSDEGDSGAIVLTRKDEQLHAVGVIYGDCFDVREFKNLHGNESIAVFLLDALHRFKTANQQEILLDKI